MGLLSVNLSDYPEVAWLVPQRENRWEQAVSFRNPLPWGEVLCSLKALSWATTLESTLEYKDLALQSTELRQPGSNSTLHG